MYSRRQILTGAACAMAGAALPRASFAQGVALQLTELRPGFALIQGAGGNILAASGEDGVTMVDAGTAARAADTLAAVEQAFPGQPLRTLFNTHWHPEQTGGNLAAARAGARIVAHANTRLWLTTDVTWPWSGETVDPLPEEDWPTEIFYNERQASGAGAARAEYAYMLQAHTDGDIWVRFPEANIICSGGVLSADRWPVFDWWTGGWFGGQVEALETMLQIVDDQTIIVPSDGPVFGRAELQAQRDMFADLFLHFRDRLLYMGLSPDEAVDQRPTAGLRPEWGDPDPFVIRAFQSLWGYYAADV
jgi:glyoxylase-like metal-dependent hydrolase (beta-lactamase superfamily II)